MKHLPTPIKVLYIDDEQANLTAFQASFRRKFTVFTASCVAEGMNVLNEEEVHVIIADQRMPHTTGVEFFRIIRNVIPNPIRILITGYTDIDSIIDAINSGEIYRYIKKPWDQTELEVAINQAYDTFNTRKDLNDKIIELQKTNDELNRFVYSTSHDLRSPLANIMAILNLAKTDHSVIDPNNYLGMIESSVNRMDMYIHKIIEYYRSIRVGEYWEMIDFEALLKECIAFSDLQGQNIHFELNINQPVKFTGDAFRISIIMNNLISNAIKYRKPDETKPIVKLSVDVTEKEVCLDIEDNGLGIIESHLNSIFQMFFRSIDHSKGLGLGLYIVKEALNRLNGNISVQSEIGKGTIFSVKVPNQSQSVTSH